MPTASQIIAGRALVLIEAIDKTGKVFKKVNHNFKQLGHRVRMFQERGVKGFDAFRMAILGSLGPLRKLKFSWAAVSDFILETTKRLGRRMQQFGAQMRSVGLQLTLLAGLMTVPIVSSVREAANFETELLKARTAANLTVEQMEELEQTIKRISRETTFIPEEIAAVAKELARAGLSGKELEAAIRPILNLSRAQDYDPVRTTELFVQSVVAFRKDVDQFEDIANKFSAAADSSIADMEDFGAAWGYVVNQVTQTKLPDSEALGLLSLLSFSGLGGTKGGTSLNRLLGAISEKSEDIQDTFGVAAFADTGALRNPIDILKDLVIVLKALPDEEKLPNLTRIFDQRGVRALLSAADNYHLLKDLIEQIEHPLVSVAEKARILDQGLTGSIRRINRSISNLKSAIGDALEKPIRRLADGIEHIVDRMKPWIEANQHVVQQLVYGIAILGAYGISLTALGTAFGMVGFVITQVAGAIQVIAPLLTAALAAVGIPLSQLLILIGGLAAWSVIWYGSLLKLLSLIKDDIWESFVMIAKDMFAAYQALEREFKALAYEVGQLWQVFRPFIVEILRKGLRVATYLTKIAVGVVRIFGPSQIRALTHFLTFINAMINRLQLLAQLLMNISGLTHLISASKFIRRSLPQGEEDSKQPRSLSDILKSTFGIDPKVAQIIRERTELLKKRADLLSGLSSTATASSITIEKGSAQNVETTFRDKQQAESLNLLRQIEDRLRQIEQQQRTFAETGFQGI